MDKLRLPTAPLDNRRRLPTLTTALAADVFFVEPGDISHPIHFVPHNIT
jgi:hypothetical protein